MSSWATALLTLLGVVLGAGLQSVLGRHADRERQTGVLRSQAYADYLRAVAAAAHFHIDDDLRDALRDVADAKARIAVYGQETVVRALAHFEAEGATLTNDPGTAAFVSLVSSMRSDGASVSERDLRLVLLGASSSSARSNRAP